MADRTYCDRCGIEITDSPRERACWIGLMYADLCARCRTDVQAFVFGPVAEQLVLPLWHRILNTFQSAQIRSDVRVKPIRPAK